MSKVISNLKFLHGIVIKPTGLMKGIHASLAFTGHDSCLDIKLQCNYDHHLDMKSLANITGKLYLI